MVSKKITVTNTQGFHMRPAMTFATEMGKFPCAVSIVTGTSSTDGKSLMNIIAACIKCGTEIEIICDVEQPAMCLSRGKEEIFLKPMHKNTNLSAFVKGKTSVLRPPLTNASKFV